MIHDLSMKLTTCLFVSELRTVYLVPPDVALVAFFCHSGMRAFDDCCIFR